MDNAEEIVIDTSKLSHDEIQYFIDSFKRSPVLLKQFDQDVLRIAHWKKYDSGIYHCSACMAKADYREEIYGGSYEMNQHLAKYCWNCGRKMCVK